MGEAAPTLVPGLMAATPAAASTNIPAEAACAPRGVTKTATGSGASRIELTISRAEALRPPGVLSWMTSRAASASVASSMARAT